jgi:hypothetical protein
LRVFRTRVIAQRGNFQWSAYEWRGILYQLFAEPRALQHRAKLPQELRRSLAWHRKEMADHKSFTIATNLANTSPIIVYQSRAK